MVKRMVKEKLVNDKGDRSLRIYWVHGLYSTEVFGEKSRGGLVRTKGVQLLLKDIIPSTEIIDVVVKPPFRKIATEKGESEILEFPLERNRIFIRAVSKFLRSLSPLSNFGVGIGSLSTGVRCEKFLRRVLRNKEKYLLVIDSIRGYMSIKQIFDELADNSLAVLYLSHNYEPEFVGSKILWSYIEKVERNVIRSSDLVLAASLRDSKVFKCKYGVDEQRMVVLPNIYPVEGLKISKTNSPSVTLVLPDNWGVKAITNAIDYISMSIRMSEKVKNVIIIGGIAGGISRQKEWGGSVVETYGFIKSRRKFLEVIGRGHIGLNFAFKSAGTNVKKYDYAITEQVVLSNILGAKGDLLPYEYTFMDEYDLASKIDQVFDEDYLRMGEQNASFAHKLYRTAKEKIKKKLLEILK